MEMNRCRMFLLGAAAAFAATACIEFTPPDRGDAGLAAEKDPPAKTDGYMAMTATFDLESFLGHPAIEIDLNDLDSGESRYLKIEEADIEAFGKDRKYVPILFHLKPGRYEMTASKVHLPAGSKGVLHYEPSESTLGFEKHLAPFTIESGKILHLAVIKFSATQSLVGRTAWREAHVEWQFKMPERYVWQPFQNLIGQASFAYLLKDPKGAVVPKLMTFTAADFDPINSEEERTKTNNGIVEAHRDEVHACKAKHSPEAHGKVVVSYVIAPGGNVDVASIKSTTLNRPDTETCILAIFRKLTFPKPPHNDFDSWHYYWIF